MQGGYGLIFMNKQYERNLKQGLVSLKLPPNTIEQIIKLHKGGEKDDCKEKLLGVRIEFLNKLHQAQENLYRLDVLIHNLEN